MRDCELVHLRNYKYTDVYIRKCKLLKQLDSLNLKIFGGIYNPITNEISIYGNYEKIKWIIYTINHEYVHHITTQILQELGLSIFMLNIDGMEWIADKLTNKTQVKIRTRLNNFLDILYKTKWTAFQNL